MLGLIDRFLEGRGMLARSIMLICGGLLLGVGLASIYAVEPMGPYWKKQLLYAGAGLAGMIFINLIYYKNLGAISYWIYGGILVLLAILLAEKFIPMPSWWRSAVPYVNGSRRWIRLGAGGFSFQIQPSEFCKVAHILALAWYLRFRSNYRELGGLIGPFVLTLLAMVLILLEPDLGTVLLMMPVLFSMLFVAGAKVKHLAMIVGLAILVSPLLWMNMHAYQRMRISSVLLQNEWVYQKAKDSPRVADVLAGGSANLIRWKKDKGYHLTHSKYAISSGGLAGYGFGKGPYLEGDLHLPEAHNDFVFAVIAHQWGLLGCVGLFLLYGILAACGLEIALMNTDPFGRLVAVGIVTMFMVQVVVNVSMTIGLMPITGLTLPLVSYGGSSLIVNMLAIGLLNNIGRARPFSVAKKSFEYDESSAR